MPQGRASDRALVAAVIDGGEQSWSAFEAHCAGVIGKALSRALARWRGVRADEDDLRQSLRIWLIEEDYRRLRSYQGDAALSSWVYIVALRHFQRRLSQLAAEQRGEVDAPHAVEAETTPEQGPEGAHWRRERNAKVRAVIDELPERDRLLIKLLLEQEANASQAAALLGMTPDAVRMRKMRLLRGLADRLEGLWP